MLHIVIQTHVLDNSPIVFLFSRRKLCIKWLILSAVIHHATQLSEWCDPSRYPTFRVTWSITLPNFRVTGSITLPNFRVTWLITLPNFRVTVSWWILLPWSWVTWLITLLWSWVEWLILWPWSFKCCDESHPIIFHLWLLYFFQSFLPVQCSSFFNCSIHYFWSISRTL